MTCVVCSNPIPLTRKCNRWQTKYCSDRCCKTNWRRKRLKGRPLRGKHISCLTCGKLAYKFPRWVDKPQTKYCSPSCRSKMVIRGHGPIKGTKPQPNNRYRRVQVDGKRVYLHRWLMEQKVKRKLFKNEHVHHINGDPQDNRLENLQLLSDSEHGKIEWPNKLKAHS